MVRKIVLSLIAVLGICAVAMAQNQQVSGTVTDAAGAPVAGATVMVDGTTVGTTTSADGAYSISVPREGVLLVTFIGYEPQRIAVAGKTRVNVVMKEDTQAIDEVIVFAPYFGEYKSYAANFDAEVVEVAPDFETFQPDLAALEKAVNEKTKAVIVNTPNNPTGVIYHEETMKKMAEILEKKEKEIGHEIYLISDEPYRELVYDGNQEDFLTKYYRNTIVGYSFSKSLSLPGERIGYVVVPDEVENADQVIDGIVVSNRTLGFVNAPSLLQKAVAKCLDEKTNLVFYDENRKMLYEGLQKLGFHCIKPEGAFYMWVKSPETDEEKFVAAGKKYNIIMVKGSAFGCAGYVRLAYCVSHETVKNALTAFEKLAEDYGLYTE